MLYSNRLRSSEDDEGDYEKDADAVLAFSYHRGVRLAGPHLRTAGGSRRQRWGGDGEPRRLCQSLRRGAEELRGAGQPERAILRRLRPPGKHHRGGDSGLAWQVRPPSKLLQSKTLPP